MTAIFVVIIVLSLVFTAPNLKSMLCACGFWLFVGVTILIEGAKVGWWPVGLSLAGFAFMGVAFIVGRIRK